MFTVLAWLLGILGVGGAGIGVAALLGGGPAMLGIGLKVLGFAKRLSPRTWLYIGAAAALVVGVIWHQSTAHKKLRDTYTAGYNKRAGEDASVLAALRTRVQAAEANAAKLSQEVRNKHDQEVDANAVAAHALFVRGPGAASCRSVRDPGVPTGSGGNDAGHRQADAAVAQMPAGEGVDLFGLPIDGAAAFGQQNDDLLAEVKAWHSWYPLMVAEWEKLRAKPR